MKILFEGYFQKAGKKFKFKREVEASNIEFAKHKLLSLFGSEHGVKRRFIKIEKVEKIEGDGK